MYFRQAVPPQTTQTEILFHAEKFRSSAPFLSHSQLRCLYLERNLISTIKGLDGLENLVQVSSRQRRTVSKLRRCSAAREYSSPQQQETTKDTAVCEKST